MKVWSIANQKGGVGKTTTTVSLAGLLAKAGSRVLMLDLDPQGSMTSYFHLDPEEAGASSHDLFLFKQKPSNAEVKRLIKNVGVEGLDLLPACTLLATIERQLKGVEGLGLKVSLALKAIEEDYDYVLIDTPPILGVLLINALAACEQLLIPCQTEHLAIKGLERMLHTIAMVNRSRKVELPYCIIPTMFDRRTQASISSLRHLRQSYETHLWPAMIPIDTRFRDASKAGMPISELDIDTRGCQAYKSLIKYLSHQLAGTVAA